MNIFNTVLDIFGCFWISLDAVSSILDIFGYGNFGFWIRYLDFGYGDVELWIRGTMHGNPLNLDYPIAEEITHGFMGLKNFVVGFQMAQEFSAIALQRTQKLFVGIQRAQKLFVGSHKAQECFAGLQEAQLFFVGLHRAQNFIVGFRRAQFFL